MSRIIQARLVRVGGGGRDADVKFLMRIATVLLVLASMTMFVQVALANDDLDNLTHIDCDENQVYSDAGDADAAAALDAAGYTCTGLFNKGQLPNTFQQVGELWHRTSDSLHQMRIIIFNGPNTGFGDSKVCLDDDPDPINNVADGPPGPTTCIGRDADQSVNHGFDGGPSYPPAPAAGDGEEPAGKMELKIENLIEISESFGGTAVGGWNVNIDDYTEVILHFNHSGFSIVAWHQPNPEVFIQAILSGTKWLDGAVGTTGIEGWDILIYDEALALLATVTTDVNGEWTHTTDEYLEGTEVTLNVCEEQPGGWDQTGPMVGDAVGNAVAVDLGALGICWQVTFTAGDQDVQISGLDFVNRPTGAIAIVKTAKHADTSGDTSANLVATFTITGPSHPTGTDVTTDSNGMACIDGLIPGVYEIEETGVPTGYAAPAIDDVTVPGDDPVACGDGDEVSVSVDNTPLTDITWEVDSLHDGATMTHVRCTDDEGNVVYDDTVGDGTHTFEDLHPTDPDVTITCEFTVDP